MASHTATMVVATRTPNRLPAKLSPLGRHIADRTSYPRNESTPGNGMSTNLSEQPVGEGPRRRVPREQVQRGEPGAFASRLAAEAPLACGQPSHERSLRRPEPGQIPGG